MEEERRDVLVRREVRALDRRAEVDIVGSVSLEVGVRVVDLGVVGELRTWW